MNGVFWQFIICQQSPEFRLVFLVHRPLGQEGAGRFRIGMHYMCRALNQFFDLQGSVNNFVVQSLWFVVAVNRVHRRQNNWLRRPVLVLGEEQGFRAGLDQLPAVLGEVVPLMRQSHMGVLDHQVHIKLKLKRFLGDLLIARVGPVDPAVYLVTLLD